MTDENAERLKQLIRDGKTKKYVLYDDIDGTLPAGFKGGSELDDILSELANSDIEVLEELPTEHKNRVNIEEEFLNENELQEISKQGGDAAALRMYLREVELLPSLSREEEIELATRIAAGGQDAEVAEKHLIEANLRLVVKTARRYRDRGRGLLELVQEGNIGLMKAVKNFDHNRGYKFSTFAIWWVRHAMNAE